MTESNSNTLPLLNGALRCTDLRDVWVGSERASEEMGIGRTQVWRLASKKWAPMQDAGETPPVRVLVMGTDDRPEYKFLLDDVVRYARERRLRKAQNRLRKSQRGLRLLMPFLRANPHVLVPIIATQRLDQVRRRARRASGNGQV